MKAIIKQLSIFIPPFIKRLNSNLILNYPLIGAIQIIPLLWILAIFDILSYSLAYFSPSTIQFSYLSLNSALLILTILNILMLMGLLIGIFGKVHIVEME